MTNRHTPGPWMVVEGYHVLGVHPMIGTDNQQRPGAHYVVSFKQPKSGARRGESPRWFAFSEEVRANAHLIAAAPDLLAALKEVMRWESSGFAPQSKAQAAEMAFAAIAKAEGKSK